MNIVNIRELAKRMCKTGLFNAKTLEMFLKAPVFLYTDMPNWSDDEIAWVEQNILGGEDKIVPVKMPYHCFIVCCDKVKEDPETTTSVYFVYGNPITIKTNEGSVDCLMYVIEAQKDDDDGNDYWMACGYTGHIKKGVCINMFMNEKSHDISPLKRGQIGSAAASIRSVVTRVCFDVMSKASAVVKVSPKPRPDKGIEWHLARTHYCILSKKQAMHIRDRSGGITRHQESRAAHWRRAHFRTLRSERFKGKRHQKIPVIEAWVGPDEWLGNDGKIYKVVH